MIHNKYHLKLWWNTKYTCMCEIINFFYQGTRIQIRIQICIINIILTDIFLQQNNYVMQKSIAITIRGSNDIVVSRAMLMFIQRLLSAFQSGFWLWRMWKSRNEKIILSHNTDRIARQRRDDRRNPLFSINWIKSLVNNYVKMREISSGCSIGNNLSLWCLLRKETGAFGSRKDIRAYTRTHC